ncbi:MAG: hypothetical protein HFK07_01070 [Clostridia bacterium]|jgi:hypothetical protein|nr:hypothetical protein [Clostridia bacterium]
MEEKDNRRKGNGILSALGGLVTAFLNVICSILGGIGLALKEVLVGLPFLIVLTAVGFIFIPDKMIEAIRIITNIFGGKLI